ncbi:hypothetical protein O8E94_002984 [Yersinia ruckeri]|nr:hypothetical protein [Yersinia ruckeri]
MNESMVLRFQAMALDNQTPVTALLRMAKAIATKLELQDVYEWIDKELHGYSDTKMPEYRKVRGTLRAVHPMRGLMEAPVENRKLEDDLSTVYIKSSLGELESVPSGSSLSFPLSTQLAHNLQASEPEFLRFSLVRIVGNNKLVNIAEQVRNRLLSWSLELEQQGILGENLQFSQQDKERAPMTTNNFHFNGNINNAGVIGADNHDFAQRNTQQIVAGGFGALQQHLRELGISDVDINELKNALDNEPMPKEPGRFGPKVSAWLGKISGMAAQGLLQAGIDKAAPLAIAAISRYLGA